ncbi:MAG: peptidoglycan bridge formation glycyltransferase FemA/FemB family protein [Desulfovibrionales bacterium]|nr:peptidoglycan bridge formation glycyltransferase FemA/FemB family protein [Desulfovibrionales bacterium]
MLDLSSKTTSALLPTDILFQTRYWAQVKSRLGYTPMAFDLLSSRQCGDVLVLLQPFGRGKAVAYVPQGPEFAPAEEDYGPFLEHVSVKLSRHLGPKVAFIRYDLPWKSQYADEMQAQKWNSFPEPRIRELRMNMGTRFWNIRKSFRDMTVASSLVVDIVGQEEHILGRMKPKTRYNIGLAHRKGVTIRAVSVDKLREFHSLYCQTASRNGFSSCSYRHFVALFSAQIRRRKDAEILFLLAQHGRDILAGAIVAITGKAANFLYGASANIKRNFMGPYALHWDAMLMARARGCATYEMGAVSPGLDPAHPFYGLYRFKTGFGGRIELRNGSWDYPLDHDAYQDFCNAESLDRRRAE